MDPEFYTAMEDSGEMFWIYTYIYIYTHTLGGMLHDTMIPYFSSRLQMVEAWYNFACMVQIVNCVTYRSIFHFIEYKLISLISPISAAMKCQPGRGVAQRCFCFLAFKPFRVCFLWLSCWGFQKVTISTHPGPQFWDSWKISSPDLGILGGV